MKIKHTHKDAPTCTKRVQAEPGDGKAGCTMIEARGFLRHSQLKRPKVPLLYGILNVGP
jgi:hypothetical protein